MAGEDSKPTTGSGSSERLKLPIKLAYGSGAVAYGVATLALSSSVLQPYLNRVIGLPAIWVGTAIMGTLMLDAIFDPTIGRFSDNLRTRWGRRHPLMYLSVPLVGLSCAAFWNTPQGLSPAATGALLIGLLVLMRLSISLFEVPSNALGPELTADYHERTNLFSYRLFFAVIGGLTMNIVLYQVFLRPEAGGVLNRDGYGRYGLLAAAVMAFTVLVSALGTHRRIAALKHAPRPRISAAAGWREIRDTLVNRSLIVVMVSGLCSGVSIGLTNSLSQYFYLELWGFSAAQISYMAVAGVLASVAAVATVGPVGKAFGKKRAMIGVFTLSFLTNYGPITLKVLGLMPPNSSPWVFIILVVDTFVFTTLAVMGFILVTSMVADVAEDAAVKTGVRSEGLLFAANGLMPKFSSAIGVFLAGLLLTLAKFPVGVAEGAVDPQVMRGLALTYIPIAATMTALSIVVLVFYRIDKQIHERNLQTLREAAALAELAHIEEARPVHTGSGA